MIPKSETLMNSSSEERNHIILKMIVFHERQTFSQLSSIIKNKIFHKRMSQVNFQFQGPDCVGTYNLNVGFMQMGHLIISHITVIKSRTSGNTSLGGKNIKRRELFQIPIQKTKLM